MKISDGDSDKKVLETLTKFVDSIADQTIIVLSKRLESLNIPAEIKKSEKQQACIIVEVSKISDTDRIKRLLTTRNKLEIWEAYNIAEVMNYMFQIDRGSHDALDRVNAQALTFTKPFYACFGTEKVNENGSVLYINHADRDNVDAILHKYKDYSPSNLKFMWSYQNNEADIALYTMRGSYPHRGAALDGSSLVEVKNKGTKIEILTNRHGAMQLNRVSASLKRNNMALVLDKSVYSLYNVSDALEDGRIVFELPTKADAKDIKVIMGSGDLNHNLLIQEGGSI